MQKFFFDRVSGTRSEFDYRGCELASVDRAAELAELIALDLAVAAESEWIGWNIRVSNADGRHFLTIPVKELEMAA